MGFRQAAVLAPVSFFLGVFFICFNIDHRVLWGELTEDVVKEGFQFYTTFFNAPPAIKALLHGMAGVGLVGMLSKLHKWDESAVYFDGSCLASFVFAIVIYLTVTIPALQAVAGAISPEDASPEGLLEDRIQAMRVLSAGNVIMIACMGAILVMQAGQEYARRTEAKALAAIQEQEKKAAVSEEKKDQ